MSYITTPLNSSHNKKNFSCGNDALDDYFHYQATQDMKRKLAVCFVLAGEKNLVKGFYTLSNDNVSKEIVPDEIRNKMPRAYSNLPTTLLGRLAIDSNFKKLGLGELLLVDALRRCFDISKSNIGSMAVVVDPLDENAKTFYKKYGFIILPDSSRMFLPMATIGKLFK